MARIAKRPEKCESHILRDLLLLVGYNIPLHEVRTWTPEESAAAEEWAGKTYLRASDNPIRVPKKPEFLEAYSKYKI